MKNYHSLTLRQLDVEKKKLADQIVIENRNAKKQGRTANFEPILKNIETVGKILEKRTGPPCRSCITKKKQRELGMLPSVT